MSDAGSTVSDMKSDRGTKRDGDLLFVGETEPVDGDNSGCKRVKTSHGKGTTYRMTTSDLGGHGQGATEGMHDSCDLPRLAFFHPSFTEAERAVFCVCEKFIEAYRDLKRTGYINQAVEYVCLDLDKLRDPSAIYPFVGPIGCLGVAGVGKSSFLNAVLAQKMIAVEHDGDERGTYVVHEYTSAHPKQVQQYQVEVPYLTDRELSNMVCKHHSNINKYLKSKEEEEEEELEDDEDEDLVAKYETAIDFFCDLLCDQEGFQTLEETKEYFQERENEEDNKIRSDLLRMINSLVDSRAIADGKETFNARDEAELSDVFKQVSRPIVMRGKKGRLPSPWPIIRKVQVRQDLALLNAGVTLADTAGVNDSNLAVVENTRAYLAEAGTILVFTNIKRISTDIELDKQLKECIQLDKIDNIILVVTGIDAKKDFSSREEDELDQHDLELLDAAKAEVLRMNQQIKEVTQEKKNELDNIKFRELDQRLVELKEQSVEAQRSLHQLIVEIHCRNIRPKLENKLQKLAKSKKAPLLKVVFVSNSEYQKHFHGYSEQDPPSLDLEGTGIPEARRLLYRIPARGKLHILKKICSKRLPHIFSGVNAILTKSTLERKEEVKRLLEHELKQLDDLVPYLLKKILKSFETCILQCIKQNNAKWIQKGNELASSWDKGIRPATFAAFCRKFGSWKLPHNKPMEWNSSIREISDSKLLVAFDDLDDEIDRAERGWNEKLRSAIDTLKEHIESCEASQGIPMNSFFVYIDGEKEHFEEGFTKHFDQLKREINRIRAVAVVDGKTTYIAQAMVETYQKCAAYNSANYNTHNATHRRGHKKKHGVHAVRTDALRDGITGGHNGTSVFQAAGALAKADLQKALDGLRESGNQILNKHRGHILRDFDSRYADSEVKVEENPDAVAALQKASAEAMSLVNGPMKQHLEEAESYERGGAWKVEGRVGEERKG